MRVKNQIWVLSFTRRCIVTVLATQFFVVEWIAFNSFFLTLCSLLERIFFLRSAYREQAAIEINHFESNFTFAAAKNVFRNVCLREQWKMNFFPRERLRCAFWCLSTNKWTKRHKFASLIVKEMLGSELRTVLFLILANPSPSNLFFFCSFIFLWEVLQQRFVIFLEVCKNQKWSFRVHKSCWRLTFPKLKGNIFGVEQRAENISTPEVHLWKKQTLHSNF